MYDSLASSGFEKGKSRTMVVLVLGGWVIPVTAASRLLCSGFLSCPEIHKSVRVIIILFFFFSSSHAALMRVGSFVWVMFIMHSGGAVLRVSSCHPSTAVD